MHLFRNDTNNKKIFIILTFLGLSVAGAIVLSFVNVHYDFLELRNFYRGYMGRRLLIQEGRLLTKTKHKAPKDAQVIIKLCFHLLPSSFGSFIKSKFIKFL